MFGIGAGELMLLLILALFVLGPERMPKMARDIGKTVGDLRRTSDDLKREFMNSDAVLDRLAALPPSTPVDTVASDATAAAPEATAADAAPATEPGLTQAAVIEPEPDETEFDREARLARERLDDPERKAEAGAEGWKPPTDEAGTNPERWG